jgi:hypothetical protein
MNLKTYLDLYAVLKHDRSTREEKRAFGLQHQKWIDDPLRQLRAWSQKRRPHLKKPLFSDTFSSYLYGITLTLSVVAFFLGFFSGIGLLSYSGHEPVNIIYFLAVAVALPLVSISLSLLAMLRANRAQSFLVHISPAYWMERIVHLLPGRFRSSFKETEIPPRLSNWLVIVRSQLLALLFSAGLLCALLGMVVTKDIAFAWSTTLHISPEAFHTFLSTLAFAWKDLFPWAVPSVELIEQSQYFRLGEQLDTQMIAHASKLGEWWKFLAFATLFYAILLRIAVWCVAKWGYARALKRSFLSLEGVAALLADMNEPVITTSSNSDENAAEERNSVYMQETETLDRSYDRAVGWSMAEEALHLLNEHMSVITPKVDKAGGGNSLEEDSEIISRCTGEIVLYVKAWEPPTMDFMDFLEEMAHVARKIVVVPVGTAENAYRPKVREVEVWGRKLQRLESEKVWLKR